MNTDRNLLRYRNPVYPNYFADPFVWKHDGVYYAVGTGLVDERDEPAPRVFQLLRSADFVTWSPIGSALKALAPDYGEAYWAPEVAAVDGKFYLYYSVGRGDKAHHIRVATSETPEGPFEDCGAKVTDPFSCPFAIDASPFQDDDGQWYLFYARDFLDTGNGSLAGTGVVVDRLADMTRLAGTPQVVVRARHSWQRFLAGRIMYGGVYDWHTIEGPCVRKHDGRYYCFYSAGRWENDTYGVDWAVADHVMGPYDPGENSAGARLLRTIPGRVIGPGHNCIATGPDGRDYIVYHAWDPDMTARRMFIDPLEWTPQGPRCTITA